MLAPTSGRAQNASCLSFSERFCFGFSPRTQMVYFRRSTREFRRRSPILPIDSAMEPEVVGVRHGGGRIGRVRYEREAIERVVLVAGGVIIRVGFRCLVAVRIVGIGG